MAEIDGIVKGKLSCGFSFEIPKTNLTSYNTLKMLKAVDKDWSKILDVVPRILGEKQEEELIKALGGEPSFYDVYKAIEEMFNVLKEDAEIKKSSPLPNS